MKKIVLIDASQRERANSEIIVKRIAAALSGVEVHVLHMKKQNCQYCTGCDICQKSEALICSRKDDITKLLPHIDTCDAILITSPVYDHQMSSLAKLFIERFYAFYNPKAENTSSVKKERKKRHLLCVVGRETKKYIKNMRSGLWKDFGRLMLLIQKSKYSME